VVPAHQADFLYSNGRGKFRFYAECRYVNDVAATFALPTTIRTIETYSERRSSARVPWVIPVQWRYAPGGEGYGDFLAASMMDLSQGGASLVVGRELKPGAQVEVRFTLKSPSEPLVEVGQVVRAAKIETSNRSAAGIRFLDVGRENERILSEFVSERQALRRERGVV
jgi:c-di-GMP-binding flagellar brake protein YcgR